MSQFRVNEVWTEREGDIPGTPQNESDWEACVATAYSMALLYGGVSMAAPYTQAQRELIEYYGAPADRDQDLTLSDTKSREVYGVALRGPSVTSSKAAFLARPGLGFCLTGIGSPAGAQAGTFMHEVFAICVPDGRSLAVFDPLLPAGAVPVNRSIARMAVWMKGLGANDVREVAKGELAAGDAMIENLHGLPNGSSVQIVPGRPYQFFGFENGARWSSAHTFPSASSAGTEGIVDLAGEPPAYFLPSCYVGAPGMKKNVYLPTQYVQKDELYVPTPPPSGISPEEAAKIAKNAAHAAAKDVAEQADITLVTTYAAEKYPA